MSRGRRAALRGGGRLFAALTGFLVAASCRPVGVDPGAPPPPAPTVGEEPEATLPREPGPALRPSATSRRMGPVLFFPEVRGLWVVRSSLTSAEEIRALVDRAAAAGFNTLVVQVRGRGTAYYRSRWEPRAAEVRGSPGFDPLALVIEEAHGRGLAVHAWVNTHLVASAETLPDDPDHLVRAHPDWLAVPRELARELFAADPTAPAYVGALAEWVRRNGGRVEGLYTSPSHPAVQERVHGIWTELTDRYALDGIHFDYVRYPSGEFDYSRDTLDRFRAWARPRVSPARADELDGVYARDPLAWVDALPGPWAEFRRDAVTSLVERVHHAVKARRPELVVSAAVFANRTDARTHRFQDWGLWLERGLLDVAVPMAYTADADAFRGLIRDARSVAGEPGRLWAGVGAYLDTPEGTVAKIGIARGEGAGGVVLFSYDWAIEEGSPAGAIPFLRRVGAAAFLGR